MNVAIHVKGCTPGNGEILTRIQVVTSTGIDFEADVPLNFAAGDTQFNNRLQTRADRLLQDQHGVAIQAGDSVKVLGGAV
jgi:hypothetical protein